MSQPDPTFTIQLKAPWESIFVPWPTKSEYDRIVSESIQAGINRIFQTLILEVGTQKEH